MILALLTPGWSAAPYADIAEGWYLEQSGRPEQAAWVAAVALQQDPGDLPAHRLYIKAVGQDMRQGPELRAMYLEWAEHEAAPAEAKVAAAVALAWTHDRGGAWCEQMERLLAELPAEPEARFWALRTRYEARARCPGDRRLDREELVAMRTSSLPARAYGLRLQANTGPIDSDFLNDLDPFLEASRDPSYLGNLWREGLEGEALEEARGRVLGRAIELAESQDPVALTKAARVLRYAGLEDKALAVEARRDALDPGRRGGGRMSDGERTWLVDGPVSSHRGTWSEAWEAQQAWPARRAIRLLERVDASKLPPEHQADVEGWLADNHAYLSWGEEEELRHLRAAYELEPSGQRANAWAYAAAQTVRDLEDALRAMDEVLASAVDYDPRGAYWVDGYASWQQQGRADMAQWLDTRAWLLHQLQRDEEALSDLRLALLLDPQPEAVHHLHAGLVYAALGQDDPALFHLGRGLALGAPGEARLEREAWREGEAAYARTRWHSEGFEAWVAAQLPTVPNPGLPDEVQHEPGWRSGQPLANVPLTIDGEQTSLNDLSGLRVVDVWATWCGPCLAALPHFNEVARAFGDRGVTFVAISVDADIDALDGFRETPRRKHYVEAWTPPQGNEALKVDAIPATFILDEEGVILDHWTGSSGVRLETRLEALLAEREGEDSP